MASTRNELENETQQSRRKAAEDKQQYQERQHQVLQQQQELPRRAVQVRWKRNDG